MEWILSQWLSSILGKNIGRAGDRTSDLLFPSPQRYRPSYGARRSFIENGLLVNDISYKQKYKPMMAEPTDWHTD